VHSLAQVAAVSLRNPIPCINLQRALNRLLPPDIRILNVDEVDLAFHPRFDAKAKTYEYRIYRGEILSPFERQYVYHHPFPLREDKMIEVAPLLEGEHDFTAFAASDERGKPVKSKVRTILASRLERRGEILIYEVRGSGFLKHMVRNIVGVLREVGKGNLTGPDVEARLVPGCGIPSGPTAPARGLFLTNVEY
jgi:tRNA pseudouridine38-40 synthase